MKQLEMGKEKNSFIIKILFFIYCFFSYYETYLNILIGSITKYYIIFFIFFILLLLRKNFSFSIYHLAYFLWFILKIMSLLFAQPFKNTNPFVHGGNFVLMLSLVILLTALDDAVDYVGELIRYSWFFSFSMCVLALFLSTPYRRISSRLVLTLFDIQNDPNNMAALYLFAFAIFIYNLTKKNNLLENILMVGGAFIALYAIIITGSRGGLVTAVIIVFIFFINIFKVRDKNQLMFALFSLSLLPLLISRIPKVIKDRFLENDGSIDEITSKRTIIWEEAFNKFKEKPILGYGWGGYHLGSKVESTATHNTIITMVLDNGLIGAALFLYPLISVGYNAIKRWNVLILMILAAGMIPALNIDGINKRFWWNTVIIIILLSKEDNN